MGGRGGGGGEGGDRSVEGEVTETFASSKPVDEDPGKRRRSSNEAVGSTFRPNTSGIANPGLWSLSVERSSLRTLPSSETVSNAPFSIEASTSSRPPSRNSRKPLAPYANASHAILEGPHPPSCDSVSLVSKFFCTFTSFHTTLPNADFRVTLETSHVVGLPAYW